MGGAAGSWGALARGRRGWRWHWFGAETRYAETGSPGEGRRESGLAGVCEGRRGCVRERWCGAETRPAVTGRRGGWGALARRRDGARGDGAPGRAWGGGAEAGGGAGAGRWPAVMGRWCKDAA